ncbi:MAG TPA: cysteine desulfurase NifS [Syntrophorhabdales bacterium]|nr:cysteine desulfurase NifS [Syntrophorhabdales bacterium]
MRKVYLDYNATTPIHPEVATYTLPFLHELYGNPSSMHWAGREVRPYIDQARECIADMIHAHPEEIVFTSCGTESDNHAIKGVAYSRRDKGNHIITTRVEHPGVLNTCAYLEKRGFEVTYLPVDSYGVVAPDAVRKAIRKDTILISVMHANNETGTLMPIEAIGAIARDAGVLFHSDMVQALGKIPIDVNKMQVDLAAFSGHKVYAPKGVGILYMREGVDIDNLIHGGHQEAGRRAGTENLLGIAAFGKACEAMHREMAEERPRLERLRKKLLDGIMARIEDVQLNGHPEFRLPNTLNLSFGFVESESLLIGLDLAGIAVSAGSACSSGSPEPSHVLLSMGIRPEVCQSALRISLGRDTSEEDIDYVLDVLPEVVGRLRSMSPFYTKK